MKKVALLITMVLFLFGCCIVFALNNTTQNEPIVLVNTSEFNKKVMNDNEGDFYAPKGLVIYSLKSEQDKHNSYGARSLMLLSEKVLLGLSKSEVKQTLPDLDKVLNDSSSLNVFLEQGELFNEVFSLVRGLFGVFDEVNYRNITRLSNIKIPNTDAAKTYLEVRGEMGEILGDLYTVIIGRNNNNYFLMSAAIAQIPELTEVRDKCESIYQAALKDNLEEVEQKKTIINAYNCYYSFVKNSSEIQNNIKTENQFLIEKFAIK